MERFGSVAAIGNGSRGVAPEGPSKIPTRFVWPHGGKRVFVSGSFAGWSMYIPMVPLEDCPTVFQVVCNLNPGNYQYKFCVDGEWQHDEQQPFVREQFGPVNTISVRKQYFLPSISRAGIPSRSRTEVDHNVYGHLEVYPRMSGSELHLSRRNISTFLSTHTAYELLPESGKVIYLDIDLPVNEAFNVLYEEGVSMAPVWDSSKCRFVGVLSVMDFIHIMKELMNTGSSLTVEQLETHTLAAWSTYPWGFVDAGPHECLKDVALKILQNKVSAVPIIHSSSEGGSVPLLLNFACLPGVLKCICQHFKNTPGSLPILQLPIGSIPLGTWMPKLRDSNKQRLAMLRPNAPLGAALSLLIQADVSSLPIVDDNDSLLDIYSISDVIALVKNKAYARINLEEFSIHQALLLRKAANNPYGQKCYMCSRSDTLHHVMESLTDPGARRIVVVKAGSLRVEGIISIGDVFRFLLS